MSVDLNGDSVTCHIDGSDYRDAQDVQDLHDSLEMIPEVNTQIDDDDQTRQQRCCRRRRKSVKDKFLAQPFFSERFRLYYIIQVPDNSLAYNIVMIYMSFFSVIVAFLAGLSQYYPFLDKEIISLFEIIDKFFAIILLIDFISELIQALRGRVRFPPTRQQRESRKSAIHSMKQRIISANVEDMSRVMDDVRTEIRGVVEEDDGRYISGVKGFLLFFFVYFGWLDLLVALPLSVPFWRCLRIWNIARYCSIIYNQLMMRNMEITNGLHVYSIIGGIGKLMGSFLFALTLCFFVLPAFIITFETKARDSGQEDVSITTAGDALWFTMVTSTTVGYGDRYPISLGARICSVLMQLVGVASIGIITSIISTKLQNGLNKITTLQKQVSSKSKSSHRTSVNLGDQFVNSITEAPEAQSPATLPSPAIQSEVADHTGGISLGELNSRLDRLFVMTERLQSQVNSLSTQIDTIYRRITWTAPPSHV